MNGASNFGMFANGGFGTAASELNTPMRAQSLGGGIATSAAGGTFNGMGAGYSNYMMGR